MLLRVNLTQPGCFKCPCLQDARGYLIDIVPPVLACFTDLEPRVRYYACESMYNIAKVVKGDILNYFNEIFDSLSKVQRLFHTV